MFNPDIYYRVEVGHEDGPTFSVIWASVFTLDRSGYRVLSSSVASVRLLPPPMVNVITGS